MVQKSFNFGNYYGLLFRYTLNLLNELCIDSKVIKNIHQIMYDHLVFLLNNINPLSKDKHIFLLNDQYLLYTIKQLLIYMIKKIILLQI